MQRRARYICSKDLFEAIMSKTQYSLEVLERGHFPCAQVKDKVRGY